MWSEWKAWRALRKIRKRVRKLRNYELVKLRFKLRRKKHPDPTEEVGDELGYLHYPLRDW